jgi:hypothetical protein
MLLLVLVSPQPHCVLLGRKLLHGCLQLLLLAPPHCVLLLGIKLLAGCLPRAVPDEATAAAVHTLHASANQQLSGSLGSHTPWQRM